MKRPDNKLGVHYRFCMAIRVGVQTIIAVTNQPRQGLQEHTTALTQHDHALKCLINCVLCVYYDGQSSLGTRPTYTRYISAQKTLGDPLPVPTVAPSPPLTHPHSVVIHAK